MLSAVVYFRDRAIVSVRVGYNWMDIDSDKPERRTTIVVVTNAGRRAVHVSKVRLSARGATDFLFVQAMAGVTLGEGSEPFKAEAHQDNMNPLAPIWWRVRAAVTDSFGNALYSDWLTERPHWANESKAPTGAITWNRLKNWGRKRVF